MARIIGTSAGEELFGRGKRDVIKGLGGDDRLHGEGGDDKLLGGGGSNRLYGGDGDDTLIAQGGFDNGLYGGDGDDLFRLRGDTGSWVRPGAGNDRITSDIWFQIGYDDVDVRGLVVDLRKQTATGRIDGQVFEDRFEMSHDIQGSARADTLLGGAREDFEGFRPGAGRDFINGRSGWDELMFHFDDTGRGVTLDFAKGRLVDPWGDVDRFKNIESVRGTMIADRLLGSDAEFENYRGMAGEDFINGRAGDDRVDYDQDANYGGDSGIRADLKKGFVIDGFGDRDTVKNIEIVRGTRFDDVIKGDGKAFNRLEGQEGDDKLLGRGGRDALRGDQGEDLLKGGAGGDWLGGGAGDDVLVGGKGRDLFWFTGDSGSDVVRDYARGELFEIYSAPGIEHFRDLDIRQQGDDAVIRFLDSTIRLKDVSVEILSSELFSFFD